MNHRWLAPLLLGVCIPQCFYFGELEDGQAKKLLEEGAVLVDVRSPEEYAEGHLVGAINIPKDDLPQRLDEVGGPEKVVLLYCRSGMRSSSATSTLQDLGYSKAQNLGAIGRLEEELGTAEP